MKPRVLYLVFRVCARFDPCRAVDVLRLDAILPEPTVRVEVFLEDFFFGVGTGGVAFAAGKSVSAKRNASDLALPAIFNVQVRMCFTVFHPLVVG